MPATIKMLLIGLPQALKGVPGHGSDEMLCVSFADFRQDTVLPKELDLIVAPLYRSEFDALDVIDLVAARGYRGRLRVLAKALPNQNLVLRELRAHASRRGIDVELADEG